MTHDPGPQTSPVPTLLVSIVVRWALLALAVVLAAWVVPGVDLSGGVLTAVWVALLISVANLLAQLLLALLPTPGSFVWLAVLTLAVNGLAVWIISATTSRLHVGGFLDAVAFALMVTVFSIAIQTVAQRVWEREPG